MVDALRGATSDDDCLGAEVDNRLLSFDHSECLILGVGHHRKLSFEDLGDNVSVAHELDGQRLVLGVVDPLARALVRVVKQVVAHVVEEVADDRERHNLLGQLAEKD